MKGNRCAAASSSPPCAACKFLKRRCTSECAFAPYFRADEPRKFASVHKVFGASNVTKILNEVPLELRPDAADSLAYEAEARLRDPVFGCVADISLLHLQMLQLQEDLANARVRLARYVLPPPPPSYPLLFHDLPALASQFDPPGAFHELGSSTSTSSVGGIGTDMISSYLPSLTSAHSVMN